MRGRWTSFCEANKNVTIGYPQG